MATTLVDMKYFRLNVAILFPKGGTRFQVRCVGWVADVHCVSAKQIADSRH